MKVLGIDPGYGRLGWAVLEGNRARQEMIACGCIETEPKCSHGERLLSIKIRIDELVKEHKVDEAAIEEVFFAKNAKTAIKVGEARGVVIVALMEAGIKMDNYTPLQVKRVVTGYGNADKKQVQKMVVTLLKLKEVPKPDDAADAVAVALTHMFTNKELQLG